MRRLVPVVGIVALLAGAAGCDRHTADEAATTAANVLHYDLDLRLDPDALFIEATARLQVVVPAGLEELPLDFSGLEIRSTTVDGIAVKASRRSEQLIIPLSGARDTVHITVTYDGVPETGLYADNHAGSRIVFTDSWPKRGRGWLPAVHHPADPATFSLTLEVPQEHVAVGTGEPAPAAMIGNVIRHRWSLTAAAPTYTFAFAVGDFVLAEDQVGDSLPLRYYMIRLDLARVEQLARTPRMLAFLSELLGPYPFSGYTTVQVPLQYAGMENASASFLQARLFATGDAESVQVHEVAHQWFGNSVVPATWQHLWLSEGVATYLTTLFYERTDGEAAARLRWADMASLARYGPDGHPALVPRGTVDPDAMLTWVPYQKGGSVLHLLRLVMGDDAFFLALRQTYQRFAGRPLDTATFRTVLEDASGKDLRSIFDYWVHQSSFPRVQTSWDPSTRTLSWKIDGDEGTLDGVPFLLEVRQRNRLRYVSAVDGVVVLEGWGNETPGVRPVGVMVAVE